MNKKNVLPHAGGGGRLLTAFTIAEILLSLTIIGVVAAITLPSLTGNINERTWNTQRKALYARFSQAIPLMDAINGYGTLQEMTDSATGSNSIEDTAAETFITDGLAKVMKINNICDNAHVDDCGIPSKISTLAGSAISTPVLMSDLNAYFVGSYSTGTDTMSLLDTKAAAFETQNGESILVFYNPRCVGSLNEMPIGGDGGFYSQNKVCANFLYDLNGNKGPNTVGKDIGVITAMYPSDVKLASPYPSYSDLETTYVFTDASKACSTYDSEYRLPNIEELISLYMNKNLFGLTRGSYWSSTVVDSQRAWFIQAGGSYSGQVDDRVKTGSANVRCVKR